jgi:hypothetical protein
MELGFLFSDLRFLSNLLDYADGDCAAHIADCEAAKLRDFGI